MTRRVVSVLLLAFSALGVLAMVWWYRGPTRPNIILVTFDTTRADHLGAYGYTQGLTTPFDDFARQGVIFERAYTPSPVTLPSHATMLTGLYPPEHGLRVNGTGSLSKDLPFLPEMLKQNGYETGAFIAASVLDSQFGLDRGFDTYDDQMPARKISRNVSEPRRDGQDVVTSAIAWLRKRTTRPFFCWVHLYDAHGPYDHRPDVFGKQFVDQPYDAGIAWEVRQFARLNEFLKQSKLGTTTVVVVAGDHGEGLHEHQETDHGMLLYNTTLQVPLVFVFPQTIQPNIRVKEVVSLVDITPTLLDLTKTPTPKHVSGRSLRTALQGKSIESRDCYAETDTPFMSNRWSPLRAIVSERWKYIQTTIPELYDLENDPHELTNLADTALDEVERMADRFMDLEDRFVVAQAQNLKLSESDRAKLLTLGYLSGTSGGQKKDTAIDATKLRDVKEMLPLLEKYDSARLMLTEGKYEEAITLLQQIVGATNEFPSAGYLLGNCLADMQRLEDAKMAYRTVLSQCPDFTIAHHKLGRIFSSQGDFEQAVIEFSEYLREYPDSAPDHFELGSALAQLQKFDEAIAEFREAIRLAPEFLNANLALGQLFNSRQQPQLALECFERAVASNPESVDAHAHLFLTLVQLRQYGTAELHAKKAIALAPNSYENRFNFSVFLISQRRIPEAIAQLRIAQKLRPDDPRPGQMIREIEAAVENRR
jgi:arylsulfatase A-like enzyme/Flp pilus assembly protein TadD